METEIRHSRRLEMGGGGGGVNVKNKFREGVHFDHIETPFLYWKRLM